MRQLRLLMEPMRCRAARKDLFEKKGELLRRNAKKKKLHLSPREIRYYSPSPCRESTAFLEKKRKDVPGRKRRGKKPSPGGLEKEGMGSLLVKCTKEKRKEGFLLSSIVIKKTVGHAIRKKKQNLLPTKNQKKRKRGENLGFALKKKGLRLPVGLSVSSLRGKCN